MTAESEVACRRSRRHADFDYCALYPKGYDKRGHLLVANYPDLKLYIAGEWRRPTASR